MVKVRTKKIEALNPKSLAWHNVRQLEVLANSDRFLTGLTLTTNNFALGKATGSRKLSIKSSNFFFFLDLEI